MTETKEHQQDVGRKLHHMLKKTYPDVFQKPYKPLAIGIHETLHERHGDLYSLEDIRRYLSGFTRSHFYNAEILKCQVGDPRYNLEGKPCGEVTEQGLRHAAQQYLRRWERIESPDLKDQIIKKRAEDLLGKSKKSKTLHG